MEQRSVEWFQARLGKVTASRVADVLAKIKSGESASRRNYKIQLVSERLTGERQETYINQAMQDGIDREFYARERYVQQFGEVEEVGFIKHPTLEAGASPDGMVGEDGILEIKCPMGSTHTETLMTQDIPSKYIPQVQFQLLVTGRKWCDFVSYNPMFPENLQLFVKRVEADHDYQQELEDEVKKFLDEVDDVINKLKEIK
jgi:putative phage-type endonuclease